MRRQARLPLESLQPLLIEAKTDHPTLLDWQAVYGNDHPVELEVGFGKGLFLLTSGQERPDTNFLGIEIERGYALMTATRLVKRGITNVRLVAGDAKLFLPQRVPDHSLDAVHVFFPDPWWKTRHRKRRLFTEEFARECSRILKKDAVLHLVTDVEDYFKMIIEMMAGLPIFEQLAAPEVRDPKHDLDYLTHFERKYRIEGRPIYRANFRNVAAG